MRTVAEAEAESPFWGLGHCAEHVTAAREQGYGGMGRLLETRRIEGCRFCPPDAWWRRLRDRLTVANAPDSARPRETPESTEAE